MKKTLKSNSAITLIALIITIIILLILAMVSIKLVWDGGIITHAQTATDKYTLEQEKELIKLGYLDYEMAKVNDNSAILAVEGATVNGIGPWEISFNKTGNKYTLNENGEIEGSTPKTEDEIILEKYFLGKGLTDVMDIESGTFYDDSDSITDASTSMTYLFGEEQETAVFMYFKYGNAAYKVVCDIETSENKSVSLIYRPDAEGKEGTTVRYSYDGTKEHEEEWTILYNNGDNIEIVSPNVMGGLNFGDIRDTEKAIDSYNNAVTRINKYCSDLITNTNKLEVRSIGSNPNNPASENNTMYTSENLLNWNKTYNGRGKISTKEYEQDLVRVLYWGMFTSDSYWIPSRLVEENSTEVNFYVKYVNSGYIDNGDYMWKVRSDGVILSNSHSHEVVPVVKINS